MTVTPLHIALGILLALWVASLILEAIQAARFERFRIAYDTPAANIPAKEMLP